MSERALVMTIMAIVTLVSCTAAPPTSGPSAARTSAAPSTTPTQSASPAASSPAPTQQSVPPTSSPVASGATVEPLTAAELRLVQELRPDARVRCAPRRTELPPKATAAVECTLSSALVDRVGVYGFAPTSGTGEAQAGSALAAYLARLAERGVAPRSGDCAAGRPGDRSWPANLPDEGEGGPYRETRSGCFRDVNGNANVRVTCYNEIYIGIVGKTPDIAALYSWAWQVAPGTSTQRDPPGICDRPD